MFELGMKARDTVTGYSGTVTAKCEYLGAEARICLERVDKDGDLKEQWFPVGRVGATTSTSTESRPA